MEEEDIDVDVDSLIETFKLRKRESKKAKDSSDDSDESGSDEDGDGEEGTTKKKKEKKKKKKKKKKGKATSKLTDPQAALTLEINFRRLTGAMSVDELISGFRRFDRELMTWDTMKALKKALEAAGNPEEIDTVLLGYSGPLDELPEYEQILVRLLRLPHFRLRLSVATTALEFGHAVKDARDQMRRVEHALDVLLGTDALHTMLRRLMFCTNVLNNKSGAAAPAGFKLASLDSVCDARSDAMPGKPGITLLEFVLTNMDAAASHSQTESESVASELDMLRSLEPVFKKAAGLQIGMVDASLDKLRSSLDATSSLIQTMSKDVSPSEEDALFLNSIIAFEGEAGTRVEALETARSTIHEMWTRASTFLCESEMGIGDVVIVFHGFIRKIQSTLALIHAHKKRAEKRAAKAAQKQAMEDKRARKKAAAAAAAAAEAGEGVADENGHLPLPEEELSQQLEETLSPRRWREKADRKQQLSPFRTRSRWSPEKSLGPDKSLYALVMYANAKHR